jgi:hypothetical protein
MKNCIPHPKWFALSIAPFFLFTLCLGAQDVEPVVTPVVMEASENVLAEHHLNRGDSYKTCDFGRTSCCCGHCVDWTQVPGSIRPMPRPGHAPMPPMGSGFYSVGDWLTGTCRDKPPKSGYPRFAPMPLSFYDADFRYVESLCYDERTLVEKLKRIAVTDCVTFSTGGQFWIRFMNERNSRLTQTVNSYSLCRARAFGDLMIGDRVRVFGEFIWADIFDETLPPLPVDINRGDFLNLFVDVKLFECGGNPVFARVGRQELLLGSQRLVSTLDWANVRRTFDGARLMSRGEKWDFDLFYSAFVPANPNALDQLDEDRQFGGAWTTYRPQKGHFLDVYYLYYDNSKDVLQQDIVRAPASVHTIGTRYAGDRNGLLWEYELALQMGEQNGENLIAGAATAGVGRHFEDAFWKPTLWAYYDYASGDPNPAAGDVNTFNQLYPFGHYYLGWIDLVGRQNLHDANAHLFFYPQPWLTVWLQYHHFWLNHSRDALYNAGGVAYRRDPTGAAGTNVGDEIDIVLNFHLARNTDILLGYSHLYGGGFLKNTAGPGLASDAELFYLMFQQRW